MQIPSKFPSISSPGNPGEKPARTAASVEQSFDFFLRGDGRKHPPSETSPGPLSTAPGKRRESDPGSGEPLIADALELSVIVEQIPLVPTGAEEPPVVAEETGTAESAEAETPPAGNARGSPSPFAAASLPPGENPNAAFNRAESPRGIVRTFQITPQGSVELPEADPNTDTESGAGSAAKTGEPAALAAGSAQKEGLGGGKRVEGAADGLTGQASIPHERSRVEGVVSKPAEAVAGVERPATPVPPQEALRQAGADQKPREGAPGRASEAEKPSAMVSRTDPGHSSSIHGRRIDAQSKPQAVGDQAPEEFVKASGTGKAYVNAIMPAQTTKAAKSERDSDPIGPGFFVSGSRAAAGSVPGLEQLALTERSPAAVAVRQILQMAERGAPSGHPRVVFAVNTDGMDTLEVQVTWRDGLVHALFLTESTELRNALSREWNLWAPLAREKGMQFSDPSFGARDQNREQGGDSSGGNDSSERGGLARARRGLPGVARSGPTGALNTALPIDPPNLVLPSGLRAWA